MADTVESTPAELIMEGEPVKEKRCDTEPVSEKGDCVVTESPIKDKKCADTTEDDDQTTGTKRKSDEAENEDEEEAKKVKKNEHEAEHEDKTDGNLNGAEKSEKTCGEEPCFENKVHAEKEEVVKKVVDDEEAAAPAEDVAA